MDQPHGRLYYGRRRRHRWCRRHVGRRCAKTARNPSGAVVKMRLMRARIGLSVVTLGMLAAVFPQAQSSRSGLDVAGFDRTVAPQDDLYRYVNGGWLSRVAIPADRVSYGAFVEISDRTELDLRAIIEEVSARPNRPRGSAAQQIADLYASVVDEARLEQLGASPIQPELRRIDAIRSTRDL